MTDPVTKYEESVEAYKTALSDFKKTFYSVKLFTFSKGQHEKTTQQIQRLFSGRKEAKKNRRKVYSLQSKDPKLIAAEKKFKDLEQDLKKQFHQINRILTFVALLKHFRNQYQPKSRICRLIDCIFLIIDCIPDWVTISLAALSLVLASNLFPLLSAGGPDVLGSAAVVIPGLLNLLSLDKILGGKESAASEQSTEQAKPAAPQWRRRWVSILSIIVGLILILTFLNKPTVATHFYCSGEMQINAAKSGEEAPFLFVKQFWNQDYWSCLQKGKGNIEIIGYDTSALITSESDLKRAIAFDPNYANAYLRLGWLYELRQDVEKAKDMYKFALQSPPKRAKEFQDGWFIARDRLAQLFLLEADTGGSGSLKPSQSESVALGFTDQSKKFISKEKDNEKKEDKSKQTKLANAASNILVGTLPVLQLWEKELESKSSPKNLSDSKKLETRSIWVELYTTLGWASILQGPGLYSEAEKYLNNALIDIDITPNPVVYCLNARLNEGEAEKLIHESINKRAASAVSASLAQEITSKIQELANQIDTLKKNDAGTQIKGSLYPIATSGKQIQTVEAELVRLKSQKKISDSELLDQLRKLEHLEISTKTLVLPWLWCKCSNEISTNQPDQNFWLNEAEQKKDKMCVKSR